MSWSSQLQRAISTSSCESEIYALTDTVKEVLYLRLLLEDMKCPSAAKTFIHCDNMATIQICSGKDQHLKRVKHLRELKRFLDIRKRFILGQHAEIELGYCKTTDMLADILTKPLGPTKMGALRQGIFNKFSASSKRHIDEADAETMKCPLDTL